MKAVVLYKQADRCVEIRDMPEPAIGPNDVMVDIAWAGICGTDIHAYRNQLTTKVTVPVILGHEMAGTIVDKGADVRGFEKGDRVVVETAAYVCGHCRMCRTGNYNLCPERKGYGLTVNGAFTRFVRARQEIVHHVPDTITLEEAALVEPLVCAYNAVAEKTKIEPADTVAILGPGPIGLFCVEVARLLGAGTIIVSGIAQDASRLALARTLGADVIVNSADQDPVETVMMMTHGEGADVVIDAAGPPIALRQSLQMVRRNGQITKIGWGPEPIGFSLDPLVEKAVTLQGDYSHTWPSWERCLSLMGKGRLATAPLISARWPIERWRAAFEAIEASSAIKILLTTRE